MIIFGHRLYGKTLRCGESYVATSFFHLWFVPVLPLGSVVVLRSLPGGHVEEIRTRFHWASAGLAVLRGWSAFLVLHGLFNWMEEAPTNGALYGPVATALGVVGLVLGFLVLGRTSPLKRAQLETYAQVFGHPVDLALIDAARQPLADALRERLVTTGRQYAIHYRATYDPSTQWGALALDPTMRSREFLTDALALARIEWSFAEGAARGELARTHDRIWEKLRESEPAAPAVEPVHANPG